MNAFTTDSLIAIACGVNISRASIIIDTPNGAVTVPDSIITSAPNLTAEDALSKIFAKAHKGTEVDAEGRVTFLAEGDRKALLEFAKNQGLDFAERRRKAEFRAMAKATAPVAAATTAPSLKMTI